MDRKVFWLFYPIVAIGLLADGVTTAASLKVFIQSNNIIADIFSIGGGILITLFAVSTKHIFKKGIPILFAFLWFVAVLIDLITSFYGTIHFIVLHKGFNEVVDFSGLRYDPENIAVTTVGILLMVLFSGSSISIPYIFKTDSSGNT